MENGVKGNKTKGGQGKTLVSIGCYLEIVPPPPLCMNLALSYVCFVQCDLENCVKLGYHSFSTLFCNDISIIYIKTRLSLFYISVLNYNL